MKRRAAIIGVTGYSGLELARIALRHPGMDCVAVMASGTSGEKQLAEIHPLLRGRTNLVCRPQSLESLGQAAPDVAFLCTPNEVSHELVPGILDLGIRVVDLSGAYRLRSAESYPAWYEFVHAVPNLLTESVYGLPEWHADELPAARLVANPGCYPTSILLPLLPLVRARWVAPGSHIICDAKSGVTGAGRSPKLGLLFGELTSNFRPYNPIEHRHAPEMCQELQWDLEEFSFVPHLLPVDRGIVATIYLSFVRPLGSEELEAEYRRCYAGHPFVRILGSGLPELRNVRDTNYCDIGWRLTAGGKRAVIFSAIDNLIKGAAGQAVQNFNLMFGFEETLGLLEGC